MTDDTEEPDRDESQDTGPEGEEHDRDARGRRYTDDERSAALAAVRLNEGNVNATAAQLGIPEPTLRQWVKGDRCPHLQPLAEQKRIELAKRLLRLHESAVGVAERGVDKLDAYKATLVAAIALDKAMHALGEATQVIEHRNPEQEARAAAIQRRYGRRLEPVQVTATAAPVPTGAAPSAPPVQPHSVAAEGSASEPTGTAPVAPQPAPLAPDGAAGSPPGE